MTRLALFVLFLTGLAVAQPGLRLTPVHSGPRQVASGSLRLRTIPEVESIAFTPPLSYRIHNQGFPGWSVTLHAPVPSLNQTVCSFWRYQAGSGLLMSLSPGNSAPATADQALAGDLGGQGLTVLSSQAQGDFLYTLGRFQVLQPASGPAGTYSTTLTVTLAGQP